MKLDGKNLVGKTILITGSTDGVGRLVAKRLAGEGALVLIHGRNHVRATQVLDDIRAGGRGSAEFFPADLASLAEVRRLAKEVAARHPRIDVLINNAGIGTAGGRTPRETSADGHELRFAVNYLAGFLLTRLLLPTLTQSKPARIVNVASAGQQAIDFDDVMLTRSYDGWRAYMQSKVAQIMFTIDLAHEFDPTTVTANCLHPATYMDTTMVRQSGATPISTVEEGADAILNLAVSPGLEGLTGLYFNGLQRARPDRPTMRKRARSCGR